MSWETTLYTGISFIKETFNSKQSIIEKIEDNEDTIKDLELRLITCTSMTEPKKFCPDEEDPIIWINREIKDILEELNESYVRRYKLNLLLDSFDKSVSKGRFKRLPKGFKYEDAFIVSDYEEII